ncbi:MAG TPA: dipeptidase [Candidatus Dormibacteraeota bacterium]|jgi:acetylornithine deacetylase/succinyl-diaminopimelate desuccinylase-like protein
MPNPEQFLEQTREQGLKELDAFLRIPSISSQPERADDVRRAAAHLVEQYQKVGLENAEVIETEGHPVVYADWLKLPGKPTVLLYGHYDVQPVDPLDLWESPPFEPRQQDGLLFGRGSSDDKGQIAIHWQAIHAWLSTTGELPVNLKVIAEGEEEIGSPHFEAFVVANRERLKADYCVVSDTAMAAKGLPAITYGLRGVVYFELRVDAADTDMHSGLMGGIAPNPAQALAEILLRLKDASSHVLVPGFYDGVRPLSEEERRQFQRVPFDEAEVKKTYGLTALHGEAAFSPVERNWARPTLDVNGIWGGYQGPGIKTIIPACATAKVSCRLVPDQDPGEVARAIHDYVMAVRPPSVRVTLTHMMSYMPWITPIGHPLIRAARRALQRVYGTEPAMIRSGGSIGAVEVMARLLETPCLLVGFVLPDCFAHAPNERLDLDSFYLGRKAALHLWEEIARIGLRAR